MEFFSKVHVVSVLSLILVLSLSVFITGCGDSSQVSRSERSETKSREEHKDGPIPSPEKPSSLEQKKECVTSYGVRHISDLEYLNNSERVLMAAMVVRECDLNLKEVREIYEIN